MQKKQIAAVVPSLQKTQAWIISTARNVIIWIPKNLHAARRAHSRQKMHVS